MIGNRRGYILITTMIALGVIALLGTAALGWATTGLRLARKALESEQAFYMANAGVEEAYAKIMGGVTDPPPFGRLLPIGDAGLTGQFQVTFKTEADKALTITSTGVVGATTRVVVARMMPGTPGGSGGGTGGGSTPAAPPPPGVPAQVFQQAVYSNGSLNFNNNAIVCGDVFSSGNVILDNNSQIRGSVGWPCTSITGTGKLVVNGAVGFGNGKSTVDGGWCDATHWGSPDHPCPTKPALPTVDVPSSATFYNMATSKLTSNLTLSGTRAYSNDIVYIDGDLTIGPAGAAISGTVTFMATGNVHVYGNLTCAGTCSVALVAQGSLDSYNNQVIWATLMSRGVMALGNQNTVHGNLQAGSFYPLNGGIFYPLPMVTSAPGGAPPAFIDWNS